MTISHSRIDFIAPRKIDGLIFIDDGDVTFVLGGGSVTASTHVGPDNLPHERTGIELTNTGPLSGFGPYSEEAPFPTIPGPFYSLTQEFIFMHPSPFDNSGIGNAFLRVVQGPGTPPPNGVIPEPSTMLLFGTGLAGLAAWRYRKRVKS